MDISHRPGVAALAFLALVIAACGNPPAPTPSPTAVPAPPATPTSTPTANPASETPLPSTATPSPAATAVPTPSSRGGVLRTAIPVAPAHFDVHQDASPALAQWGPAIVYSRLFRFRTDPGAEAPNGEVECDLCESWSMNSPSDYRVRLRDGASWQDLAPLSGRPVTAGDVVFSLGRQATPGWPNAPLLAPVETVEALDERTLRFLLNRPDAEFLARLADGHSRIVAPEAVGVSGDLFAGPVIGTGPWQLLDASGTGFKYVANSGYFEPGVPYADFLEVAVLAADSVRAAALRTRTVDFVSTGVTELADALAAFPELRSLRTIEPGSGVEVAINTASAPFDSPEARRVTLLAMDPWRDAGEIWHGGAMPTAGLPVPAASWLLPEETLRQFLAQPGQAAARAAAAGIAPGTGVEVTVGEFGPRYVDQALRIAQDLAEIGFRPALERVSTRRFGDEVWFGGRYQVSVGAQPPVSSVSDYLMAVHHSRGAWNTTGYRSAPLDALIEAQSAETDPARRRGLVLEIQLAALQGAHRFSAATPYTHWAWWPAIQGFLPNTHRGESFFLARTWLARR